MNDQSESKKPADTNQIEPTLGLALLPVLVLILLLVVNVYFYGEDSSYGPNQMALLMATAAAALSGMLIKVPVKAMVDGMQKSISSALVAMMILLLIGALTGTWMISGIVPAMIYYGLDILSPEIFLFATAIICAIVSVVTGSSWSTVATVGIALLGIGKALGLPEGWIAGAIISGAYFGDKISPLSDTTNLASAMAGSELITHIRYMLWTTVPSFVIALGIYFAMGYANEPVEMVGGTAALKAQIAANFNLTPIILIVPVLVLGMVIMKVDALFALFIGAVAGGVLAICVQPKIVEQVSGLKPVAYLDEDENETGEFRQRIYAEHAYSAFMNSMALETLIIDGDRKDELKVERESLDSESDEEPVVSRITAIDAELAAADLLKGKGMVGMLNTIWLIITAMCFGGIMEACGLLQRITQPLVNFAKSTGSLVATTAGSCLFINITASDQYLAIVVPGRMFRETYKDRGLSPENLSRTLEDSGTVTSVLIPWNTCGAAQKAVLGVAVLTFAPYCFFNLISPIMTILFAWFGIRIAKLDAGK